MHGQRYIGVVAAAYALKGRECARVLQNLVVRLRLRFTLWLILQSLLQLLDSKTVKCARGQNTRLQSPSIESRTVGIVTLPDDLAASDDNRAVAVVQGRQLGLGQAMGQEGVVASRHFCWCWFVGLRKKFGRRLKGF